MRKSINRKRAKKFAGYQDHSDKANAYFLELSRRGVETPTKRIEHWLIEKYGVTFHAIIRYKQRILNDYGFITNEEAESIANAIRGSLDFNIKEALSSNYIFMNDFKAIIRSGRVITITPNNREV